MSHNTDRMNFEEYAVLSGRAYEAEIYVPSLTVPRYWQITMPPDKGVYLQARMVSGDVGPIIYSVFPNAAGITNDGDPETTFNRRAGYPDTSAIIQPVTVSSPDAASKIVFAIARGATSGNQGARHAQTEPGASTIYNPGQSVIVGVECSATVPNFLLEYKWIELESVEPPND